MAQKEKPLKKRSVMLTDELVDTIERQAKLNEREFSQELRKLLTEALIRRAADVLAS